MLLECLPPWVRKKMHHWGPGMSEVKSTHLFIRNEQKSGRRKLKVGVNGPSQQIGLIGFFWFIWRKNCFSVNIICRNKWSLVNFINTLVQTSRFKTDKKLKKLFVVSMAWKNYWALSLNQYNHWIIIDSKKAARCNTQVNIIDDKKKPIITWKRAFSASQEIVLESIR